jgi:hypothetical protein
MASFHAELHLAGASYRVVHCYYACYQPTDSRGQVNAKVRHDLLQLTVDVPETDVLLAWAATAHKPLDGQVVFYDMTQLVAHETIAFVAGECVSYTETFESGAKGDGSYICQLAVAAPTFELLSGGPVVALAARSIGGGSAAEYSPSPNIAVGSGANIGAAMTAVEAAALVASNLESLDLKATAKAVNTERGMYNCTQITEALVARLRGTDPEAVAPADGQTRNLLQVEALYGTTFDFADQDFHKAFNTIANSPEGTIGLLVTLPKEESEDGMGHIVTIVNNKGVPTIIEGQHWNAYNPAEIITSSTRAARRYGDEDQVHLGLAILPPPSPTIV